MQKPLKYVFMVIGLLVLSGCAHHLELVEFSTGDILFGRIETGKNEVSLNMPDGEVMRGTLIKTANARFTLRLPVGRIGSHSHLGIVPGMHTGTTTHYYSLLRSETSNLLIEIIVDGNWLSGDGHGSAISNDGREFKVILD